MGFASDALAADWFKGTYTVEVDGRVVGSEEFKFRTSESGSFYASAKVEGKHAKVTTNLELNSDGSFRKYKDFVLEGTHKRDAIGFPFKGGIRLVRNTRKKGKEIHDLKPDEGFVVLHSRVFHLYAALARRYVGGPPVASYPVLWADRHAVGVVQVQALGPASLMKNDRSIALTAIEVRGEGVNAVIFVDEEGRPHRIEDGAYVATLRGYKLAYGAAPEAAVPAAADSAPGGPGVSSPSVTAPEETEAAPEPPPEPTPAEKESTEE
jgi:hypothetical protein